MGFELAVGTGNDKHLNSEEAQGGGGVRVVARLRLSSGAWDMIRIMQNVVCGVRGMGS